MTINFKMTIAQRQRDYKYGASGEGKNRIKNLKLSPSHCRRVGEWFQFRMPIKSLFDDETAGPKTGFSSEIF
jgi:hypothetical protein